MASLALPRLYRGRGLRMGENRCCLIPDKSCPVCEAQVLHLLIPGRWRARTIKLSLWEASMERHRFPCSLGAQDPVQVSLVAPDGISMASWFRAQMCHL